MLMSCAGRRLEQLNNRIESYWKGLRWRSPGSLVNMVDADDPAKFLSDITKRLDSIRIVDYSLLNSTLDQDKRNAMAVINYSYYQLNKQDLLSAQEVQHWQYQKGSGWRLKIESSKPKRQKQ